MRLIDADLLKQVLEDNGFVHSNIFAIKHIDNAPTVDAVEVVRCGECKKRGTGHCPMEEEYPWINNRPTDFCSYGERKDDINDGDTE